MSEEVKKLGEMLREKRKELRLSLKEVENSTSIRINYLEAIEEGRVDKLLSSVYILGFIKQYGNFLGFDGDQLVKEHASLFKKMDRVDSFSYGIGTLEKRGNTGSGGNWIPHLLWALLFIGVVPLLAYYLLRYFGWI